MITSNRSILLKSKKIVLPGLLVKELKPVALLLNPRFLIVPMFFVSVLAQLAEDLKGVLSSKEIQKLPSVKFYSKIISSGFSSVSLSILQSIARTLGSELEVLSILNSSERIKFLRDLYFKLLSEKGTSLINTNVCNSSDPISVSKYRRGLALQMRSTMVSVPIFSTHSIIVGLSVREINLDVIIESSKLIWNLLGLENEEFDFLLNKEAMCCLKKISLVNNSNSILTSSDSVKVLLFNELEKFLDSNGRLNFSDDQIILKDDKNLTFLEKSLGFVCRDTPSLPDQVFVSNNDLNDPVLRASFEQRKDYRTKIENIYRSVGKTSRNKSSNLEYLKKIRLNQVIDFN